MPDRSALSQLSQRPGHPRVSEHGNTTVCLSVLLLWEDVAHAWQLYRVSPNGANLHEWLLSRLTEWTELGYRQAGSGELPQPPAVPAGSVSKLSSVRVFVAQEKQGQSHRLPDIPHLGKEPYINLHDLSLVHVWFVPLWEGPKGP